MTPSDPVDPVDPATESRPSPQCNVNIHNLAGGNV
jgi:hypothetical protein